MSLALLARLRARPLGRFCRSVQGGRAGSSRLKVARRASLLAGAVSILTDCPRRVPGNPVPVPVLSARRGRSSVLPVRPDGTGGSSRRRRPEGASPACGAQSRPARDGCAGSTALPVPLSPAAASVPLCRSVQGEACEALDGCRAILSRSRRCRLGGADPRSCRSGQTARVGRAAEGAPKGQAPLAGRSLGPHGTAVPGQRLCRCLSLLLRPLCRSADQSRAKPAKP